MKHLKKIHNAEELEKKLQGNELFKNEVQNIVGEYLPHIPRIGLIFGGIATYDQMVKDKDLIIKDEEPPPDEMKGPPDIDLDS